MLLPLLLIAAFVSSYAMQPFETCGEGGWICHENGSELELTHDCNIGGNMIPEVVYIWNSRNQLIPFKTRVLTIQNCEKVQVDTSCPSSDSGTDLDTLNLHNIDTLEFSITMHSSHHPRVLNMSSIRGVTFDYGKFAKTTDDDAKFCSPKFAKILTLSDVMIRSIPRQKGFVYKDAEYILMDKVATSSSIVPHGMEITGTTHVEILNSSFAMELNAITFNVRQVTIRDSYFDKDPKVSATESIEMTGSKFNLFGRGGVSLKSPTVTMINNTFITVPRGAFMSFKSKIRGPLDVTKFVFKENSIVHAEGASLNFAWENFEPNAVVYRSNLINCSCENTEWFKSILDTTRNLQSLISNQMLTDNHCLNNRKCRLVDALWESHRSCADPPPECFIFVGERSEPVSLDEILDTLTKNFKQLEAAQNRTFDLSTAINNRLNTINSIPGIQ